MSSNVVIPSPGQRFVVVHYHIFKNGGSTVEAILQREFNGGFATLHGLDESATLDARELEDFLRRNPTVQAVSSHHLRYPKPSIRHVVLFDCCFLRHPLERLDSLYRYSRGSDSGDFLSLRARRMNARQFFAELLNEAPHLISNVQVMQIARAGMFTRPAHAGDLEHAREIVLDMAIPGVVGMFEESLLAAEYFVKPAFPRLSLAFIPQNVTRPDAPRGREGLVDLWGEDLYEALSTANQFDIELFDCTEQEIRRRVALIPGAAGRLEEFRSRCRRLREATHTLELTGAQASGSR
jgi:hypothetical protein